MNIRNNIFSGFQNINVFLNYWFDCFVGFSMKFLVKSIFYFGCAFYAISCGGGSSGGGGTTAPSGGGGITPPDETRALVTLSGKVADGYLNNVKVCLDVNGNRGCDADEPSGVTKGQGDYIIIINANNSHGIENTNDAIRYSLIAEVKTDSTNINGSLVDEEYIMSSPLGRHLMSPSNIISPLSTLVHFRVEQGEGSC